MEYRQSDFRLECLANEWNVGRFGVLDALNIPHLISTFAGPDTVALKQDPSGPAQEVAQALGLHQSAYLDQVHGPDVLACSEGGCQGQADGLFTLTRGLALVGKSADCPLILVADARAQIVGFAHASWRSTVAGIVPSLITKMVQNSDCQARDLVACICPSASPECYEVGAEVREAALNKMGAWAQTFFRPSVHGKYYFDLWSANTDALLRSGLRQENVRVAGLCTICRDDLFPSYRREGSEAGRFVAAIGLPAKGS
jgi:YfiH family protein